MAHTLTLSGNRSPITNLPSDILLRIFKYAYVAARCQIRFNIPCFEEVCQAEEKCFCDIKPSDKFGWDRDVTKSPSVQFPTSVASVCSRWEEIMLRVPIFWTRIVIHLDADIFSLQKLGLKLCASQDQPIEVVITRFSFSDTEDLKDIERSRMIQVITALRSHIHRCRTLQIKVVHSSSLPRLLAILPPNMPHIEELVLESQIDSGCPEVQPYSQADHVHLINWAKLKSITIDGWNLAELYSGVPTPNQQIFSKCCSLSIKFGGHGFSSTSITKLIKGCFLEIFEVDSVAFTEGDEPHQHSSVDFLTLRNLNAEVTDIMLGVCHGTSELTIDNCPSTLTTRLLEAPVLNLDNIGSEQGFRDFIRMWWHGRTLNVSACPGFDNDILHLMARMSRNVQDSYLSELENLTIYDCHNFTADALKPLVEIRTRNNKTLEGLSVGRSRYTLPEDDFRWFKERVDSFFWQGR